MPEVALQIETNSAGLVGLPESVLERLAHQLTMLGCPKAGIRKKWPLSSSEK